ncbi:hypothetical protein CKO08_01395 [Halorhodospira halochloris]|nr:hypothetical protein [Halorhodospira halochloris]
MITPVLRGKPVTAYLVGCAICIGQYGCASPVGQPEISEAEAADEAAADPSAEQPRWVTEPGVKGKRAAVGYAEADEDKEVALMRAKAEINRQGSVQVEGEEEVVASSDRDQSERRSEVQQRSHRMLGGVEVKEEWEDPDDGTVYYWVVAQ